MINEQIRAYLETLEDIGHAERRMAKTNDATSKSLLESAFDAAKVAWLLIPAELRSSLPGPPKRGGSD